MAPQRSLRPTTTKTTLLPLARKGISTRSHNPQDQNANPIVTRGKRKADNSPLKNDKIKRSALGNLTNNVNNLYLEEEKRNILAKTDINISKKPTNNVLKLKNEIVIGPPVHFNGVVTRNAKMVTRAAAKSAVTIEQSIQPEQSTQTNVPVVTAMKSKEDLELVKPVTRRISNEFEKTEESLYMSALEDITSTDSIRFSGAFDVKRRSLSRPSDVQKQNFDEDLGNRILTPSPLKYPQISVPEGVVDFDKETWNDPFQVSHYAMDIFNYLKQRESHFPIEDYMEKQIFLSKWMRSLLIDWMVEVQETFELNHETLYLAVKLVDIYLGKEIVMKDKLQLLGAAALFIACKFDERTPPLVDDFLYVCDGAYNHNELIKMEMCVLKIIDFDLGIPLSYRFLRRYARCAKVPMPTLTLARYILEFSLMDYSTISFSDSKMACAVLFLALRMNGLVNPWTITLEHYTGYRLEDFAYIASVLNTGLQRKPRETIKTIRSKYSHKIFFEVAKIPLMCIEKLFEETGLLDSTLSTTTSN